MAFEQRLPAVSLDSLRALVDETCIVEHSQLDRPDATSGHCVDDAGRALIVACRLPNDPLAGDLAGRCVAFLDAMHLGHGRFRLRDVARGDEAVSDDGSARAIHGLGVAARSAPWKPVRNQALRLFAEVIDFATPFLRAQAHAALGAVAIGDSAPPGTNALIDRMTTGLARPLLSDDWPWPEPRLTYGNAIVPHAILALAEHRGDRRARRRALQMLRWLVELETSPGHLSPTPVGGWAAGEPRPGFDQQPIEASTIADASKCAHEATGDPWWARGIELAAAWFAGDNDVGERMWDPRTGRAFDGLHHDRINRNQGAESALALVTTLLNLDWLGRRAYRNRTASR